MLEDGDPLDTSPQVQAGLILESLGDIEEAAVRRTFAFTWPQHTPHAGSRAAELVLNAITSAFILRTYVCDDSIG